MPNNAQPSSKLWLIAVGALVAASVLAIIFFTQKKTAPTDEAANPTTAVTEGVQAPSGAAAPVQPAAPRAQVPVPPAEQHCFQNLGVAKVDDSLAAVRSALVAKLGEPTKDYLEWRTLHFVNQKNEKKRIHIALSGTNSGKLRYEMRLFGVDKEDLPIPEEILVADTFNPSPKTIAKHMGNARADFTAASQRMLFSDGSSLEVELENEQVKTVHLSGTKNAFGCARLPTGELDCGCLVKPAK